MATSNYFQPYGVNADFVPQLDNPIGRVGPLARLNQQLSNIEAAQAAPVNINTNWLGIRNPVASGPNWAQPNMRNPYDAYTGGGVMGVPNVAGVSSAAGYDLYGNPVTPTSTPSQSAAPGIVRNDQGGLNQVATAISNVAASQQQPPATAQPPVVSGPSQPPVTAAPTPLPPVTAQPPVVSGPSQPPAVETPVQPGGPQWRTPEQVAQEQAQLEMLAGNNKYTIPLTQRTEATDAAAAARGLYDPMQRVQPAFAASDLQPMSKVNPSYMFSLLKTANERGAAHPDSLRTWAQDAGYSLDENDIAQIRAEFFKANPWAQDMYSANAGLERQAAGLAQEYRHGGLVQYKQCGCD